MPAPAASPSESFESIYGVPRRGIQWIDAFVVAMFPVCFWLLTLADTHHATFAALTHKLGVVGLPYTLSFLAASVLAVRLVLAARRHGAPRRVLLTYAALAAFCFFVAGEHISWGQAAVHYHTPFGYGRVNKLGLFNLHNLPGIDELHSIFLLVCGVAGLIGLWVAGRPSLRSVGVPRLLAPIVWAITAMAGMEILTDSVYMGFIFDMNIFVMRYAIEFAIGILCLLTVWLNGRALRREWEAIAAGSLDATRDPQHRAATV